MDDTNADVKELARRVRAGDKNALSPIFDLYRQHLRTAIRLRSDGRIRKPVNESDILREAYFAASDDLPRYAKKSDVPVYLWLRGIVQQQLGEVTQDGHAFHRRLLERGHLATVVQTSDADSSRAANHSVATLKAPLAKATKAELRLMLDGLIQQLDPINQEIIWLRHVEGWKSGEVAALLQMDQATASARYLAALKELKAGLAGAIS